MFAHISLWFAFWFSVTLYKVVKCSIPSVLKSVKVLKVMYSSLKTQKVTDKVEWPEKSCRSYQGRKSLSRDGELSSVFEEVGVVRASLDGWVCSNLCIWDSHLFRKARICRWKRIHDAFTLRCKYKGITTILEKKYLNVF